MKVVNLSQRLSDPVLEGISHGQHRREALCILVEVVLNHFSARSATMHALHRVPRSCARLAWIRGNATLQPAANAQAVNPPPPPAPTQQKAQSAAPTPAPRHASSKAPEKEAKTQESTAESPDVKGKRRRVRWPTSRPPITLERPRQYMRPIGVGVLPVYDYALDYIKKDSAKLKSQLAAYRADLEKAQSAAEPDLEEIERLTEKIKILEIQSEINLPSVRWKANNGLGM